MKNFGVAVKALIKNNKNQILLIYKSNKEDISPNEVDIPGGRVEFGENVEDALKREINEELGISVDVKKPSRVWSFIKSDLQLVGITFLAEYRSGDIKISDEHKKFEWKNREDILNNGYPEWLKAEVKAI